MNHAVQSGLRLLAALASAFFVSQCAYVQTSREVANLGTEYEGYNLGSVDAVWQKDGQYYVRCDACRYKLNYPWVHDTVLLTHLQTTYTLLPFDGPPRTAYHPISRDVAYALVQTNGYDMMEALNRDIERQGGAWIAADTFPAASAVRTPLRAELQNTPERPDSEVVAAGKVKELWAPLRWTLAGLDAVFVDVPATVAYNAAIPLIVPFAAFYESAQPNPL